MRVTTKVRTVLATCCLLACIPAFSQSGGQISGQIRGLDGKPARDIRVTAARVWNGPDGLAASPSLEYSYTTDKSGRFQFRYLQPGRYFLLAGNIETPTYYPGAKKPSDGKILTVTSNSSSTGLDFQLIDHPGVTVSGRVVVDWTEEHHRIALMRNEPAFLRQDADVEPDGSFVFHAIPPGSYQLNVYPSGVFWNARPIIVKEKDVKGIVREASSFDYVRGSIELDGGGPLPPIALEIQSKAGRIRTGVALLTQADSPFIVLPTGNIRISVPDLPRQYRIESFTFGNTDALKNSLIADENQRFSLRLAIAQPTFLKRIRGHVVGIERFSNATHVTLSGPNLLTPVDVPIQSDGSYEFLNVPPGKYSLDVARRQRRVVEVVDKDIDDLNLLMPVARKVSGRVIVEEGGPVPTYDMDFDKVPEDPWFDISRVPGTFEVFLPEGDVRMKFYGFPDTYEIQSVRFGDTDLLKQPLHISGTTLPEIVVRLRINVPTARVSGKVLGVSARPTGSSAVRVALSTDPASILIWVTAEADGSFEFPKVPAGTYRLNTTLATDPRHVIVEEKDVDVGGIPVRTR